MIINDFLTADLLRTFWGLIASTVLVVQFTKPLLKAKFKDGIVRLYTFIIALILTFTFAKQGTGIEGITLTAVNARTVSIEALGSYEIIVEPFVEKERGEV